MNTASKLQKIETETITRSQVLSGLKSLGDSLKEMAEVEQTTLLSLEGSLGLLLYDVVQMIGLTVEEQTEILSPEGLQIIQLEVGDPVAVTA